MPSEKTLHFLLIFSFFCVHKRWVHLTPDPEFFPAIACPCWALFLLLDTAHCFQFSFFDCYSAFPCSRSSPFHISRVHKRASYELFAPTLLVLSLPLLSCFGPLVPFKALFILYSSTHFIFDVWYVFSLYSLKPGAHFMSFCSFSESLLGLLLRCPWNFCRPFRLARGQKPCCLAGSYRRRQHPLNIHSWRQQLHSSAQFAITDTIRAQWPTFWHMAIESPVSCKAIRYPAKCSWFWKEKGQWKVQNQVTYLMSVRTWF